jgi:hypothetical protein
LRPLLVRDEEGQYDPDRQVVGFDEFAPAKSQDIDKKKTKNIKNLKVDQLRAHVKRLAAENPDTTAMAGISAIDAPQDMSEACAVTNTSLEVDTL